MEYLRVRNFDKFQHYKRRNPPWIKLYSWLLEDEDFERLPEATQIHIVRIWLLASRKQNHLPFDAAWIGRKIGAQSAVDLQLIVSSGFCERCDNASTLLAHDASNIASTLESSTSKCAMPETETETEKSREGTASVPPVEEKPNPMGKRGWKHDPDISFACVPVPAELKSTAFDAAWREWHQSRAEAEKPVTTTQARELLNRMAPWGVARAVAAIHFSIAGGYSQVYEDKKDAKQPDGPTVYRTVQDALNER